jgi:hypothetical protein
MARKFTKVLDLMKAKGGRIEVGDPDLATALGPLFYRRASYFSNIRKRAGLEVAAVREGRHVVAYELVAVSQSAEPAPTPETTAPVTPTVETPTAE